MAKKKITFTVDDFEYSEIMLYSRIKGHGGQYPTSTFAHYAVFQQMKKYPLSEAEIEKYNKRHTESVKRPKAVQPNAPTGN